MTEFTCADVMKAAAESVPNSEHIGLFKHTDTVLPDPILKAAIFTDSFSLNGVKVEVSDYMPIGWIEWRDYQRKESTFVNLRDGGSQFTLKWGWTL